jgi:hypothetical protein
MSTTATAIVINRVQRDAIHRHLRASLYALDDIHMYLSDGGHIRARELRREYEDNMRLLDDLGWEDDAPAESFQLTVEPDVLIRVLERVRRKAAADTREHVGALAADALKIPNPRKTPNEYDRNDWLWDMIAYTTCEGLLAQLHGPLTNTEPQQNPTLGEPIVGVVLTRPQRDAIRPDLLYQLSRTDNIARALAITETPDQARELHQQYQEDLHLLRDLGLDNHDPRTWFPITLPRTALHRVIGRLRAMKSLDTPADNDTHQHSNPTRKPDGPRRTLTAHLTYDSLLAMSEPEKSA